MIQLTFDVQGQFIKRTDENKIVSDSIGQFEAVFILDTWWDNYTPVAQFTKNNKTIDCLLVDSKCELPPEVTTSGGMFYVSIFATENTRRKTTNDVVINVIGSGYKANGSHSREPTETIYEQLIDTTKPAQIGENGNWYVFDVATRQYVDTGKKATYTLTNNDKQDIALIVKTEYFAELETLIDESGVLSE